MNAAYATGLALCFALLLRKRAQGREPEGRAALPAFAATIGFAVIVIALERRFSGSWDFLPLLVAAGAWAVPRGTVDSDPGESSWLDGGRAPFAAAAVTAIAVWWTWGSLKAIPVSHDEAAYVLQARIFATGHWVAPARPMPEFFEQTHVFVTPFLAAKYPPGHSLALVPGIWLGLPGLVPVLLNGLAGGLVFLLARRLSGARVATLTWLLWLMAPGDLLTRASYLSETTSAALWLVGWWALLRWRDTGRSGYLFTLAASAGWAFLTRPLTAVALAAPVGLVVLREAGRRRAWRPLAMAALVGALLAAIVPLWSWQTLGDWRTTPYRQYSRVYYPYQWSGFRFNDSRPLRPYPPEMEEFDRQFRRIQREHRVGALPAILGERLAAIGGDVWAGRRPLMAFALLGALGAPPEALFALTSSLVLVLAYLIYAHAAAWSVYYLETHATLAYLTALGLWRILSGLAARISPVPGRAKAFLRWGFRALVLAAVVPAALQVVLSRWAADERGAEQARFRNALDGIAGREAIVFVRHAATHDPHRELVANEPDLKASRAWIVRDRGGENRKLMRVAPGRAPYLYDESRHLLSPLAAGG